jgi:hypothetical protein
MKTPGWGILIGSAVGALLTIALIAVFYAGWRLADLPFDPFDVFDWTTRVLPGALIEFVISAMVAAIRGLHLGPTSVAAKIIEQAIGIVNLFITGVVAGGVLFGVLRLLNGRYARLLGFFLGVFAAIPAMLISSYLNRTAVALPLVSAIRILFMFCCWGMAISWAYQRLDAFGAPIEPGAELPGRSSGCPPLPPQTRTCPIKASGSSVAGGLSLRQTKQVRCPFGA